MIRPDVAFREAHDQLRYAAGETKPIMDKVDVEPGIETHDVYKEEEFFYRVPGIMEGELFSPSICPRDAMGRLAFGMGVDVEETVKLRGAYDGLDTEIKHGTIEKQVKHTTLHSLEELESFARIESGDVPATEEEKIAQMLERVEFNDLDGKNDGTFFEVIDRREKPISSFDAVRKLKNGETVMLRERKIKGERYSETKRAKGCYGGWLVDPKNLKKNETLYEKKGAYGRVRWRVKSDYQRLTSEVSGQPTKFHSLDQLKNFLATE